MEFFAASGVDRRYLFGGSDYWIDIKQELTAGEARKLAHSGVRRLSRPVLADESVGELGMELDLEAAAFTKVALYLVDWNLSGPDGKTVTIAGLGREKWDALRNLKPDVFAEIERAIDEEVQARADAKKPTAPGPTGSGAPSQS